jgi:hypothetical protein
LLCNRRIERNLLLVQNRLLRTLRLSQRTQTQRQQLRADTALLGLELLVAFGTSRLSLQVRQLLLDLVPKVSQALEIFFGVPDSVLGLTPPLFVFRDTRRFLEESTQVFRLRLDEARNHALLDDRVTVRAEPGAEQDVRDVLASTTRVIQKILRHTVARDDATQRDFTVPRIGP